MHPTPHGRRVARGRKATGRRGGEATAGVTGRRSGGAEGRSGGGVTKEVRSGDGERGVKCNVLILSGLCKRGVSKTDTPLSCNRLYFNILQFTLETRSRAGTTVDAAAGFAGGEVWGDGAEG